MRDYQKVLFVRLSAIGDVTHALPAAMMLKKFRPDVHIGWICQQPAAMFAEMHPCVDEVHVFPKKELSSFSWKTLKRFRAFVSEIKECNYDISIDFQGLTKSSMLPFFSSVLERVGFGDQNGREISKIFYNTRIATKEGSHVIQKNLDLLAGLEIHDLTLDQIEVPYIFLDEEKSAAVVKRFAGFDFCRSIIINPGGGWVTKIWPVKHYRELIRKFIDDGAGLINAQILIAWGPGEEELAKEIYEPFRDSPSVKILDSTTLFELSVILDKAMLVIGGDTGPIHIAAGLGTPVVSIFGPSDSRRNRPIGHAVALQDFECEPCWNRGECPRNIDLQCLSAIDSDAVFQASISLLNKNKGLSL